MIYIADEGHGMTDSSAALATTKPQARSRAGNGRLLDGIDLRTARGRRLRDIAADIVSEFGLQSASELDAALDYASSMLWLEEQAARQVRGELVDMRQVGVFQKAVRAQRREWGKRRRNVRASA